MVNSEISKIVGKPCDLSAGQHTRSDNEGCSCGGSLGDGNFLPDKSRSGYGTEGVTATEAGRSGPTGRT